MISRRTLFGLTAGAVASVMAPARIESQLSHMDVGIDFGVEPTYILRRRTTKWLRANAVLDLTECHAFRCLGEEQVRELMK